METFHFGGHLLWEESHCHFIFASHVFAHWWCNGFVPMENVRQHRDKLASTGRTVLAGSCQAVPGLVIINKRIAPFWHTLQVWSDQCSYLHQSEQLVWPCRFVPNEGHDVSEMCKNKGLSSSTLCFTKWLCLNSLSEKGGTPLHTRSHSCTCGFLIHRTTLTKRLLAQLL